jgi:hypothetical protein
MNGFKTIAAAMMLVAATAGAEEIRREINASPGETLSVDLDNGGMIKIGVWDRNSVSAVVTTDDEEVKATVERSRNGVAIKSEYDGSRRRHSSRGTQVVVTVPRKFNAELKTMGGSIEINGLEGNIGGETMGGGLKLENIRGVLDLTTMGGSITLTDSDVDGKVTTMGGKVLMRNIVGDVKGSSMGGNVVYDNVRRRDGSGSGKSVVITTHGGAIDVPSAPSGAEVKTMGGDITVKSAREFVKAHTMGGDIEITEVDGWVTATTMGGNIDVRVTGSGGKRDVKLESMGGDIVLTLPANFDGDFDIELAYTKNRGPYAIKSDFPLSISETPGWDGSRGTARRVITGKGRSGGAKHKVVISTINGDVVIRKR